MICCWDKDVLVLALHHDLGPNVWINIVPHELKKPRFLPVHLIRQGLSTDIIEKLPLYHALTGCDTTSQFAGLKKQSTWPVMLQHASLLSSALSGHVGPTLAPTNMAQVERLVMMMHSSSCGKLQSIDSLRCELFHHRNERVNYHQLKTPWHFTYWEQLFEPWSGQKQGSHILVFIHQRTADETSMV